MATTRTRKTPEQKLADLEAQQQALADALKKTRATVLARQAETRKAKIEALGAIVLAVLGDIEPSALEAKLKAVVAPVEAMPA